MKFLQKTQNLSLFLALLSLTFATAPSAWAVDFLVTDNGLWFDPADRTPVKIRVELTDLNFKDVKTFLNKYLPDQKFKVGNAASSGKVTISAEGVFHEGIVKLNNVLEMMEKQGARSANGGWPLKVQVRDLKGQDEFVAAVSGIDLKTIHEIDAKIKKLAPLGKPLIFRNYLGETEDKNPVFQAGLKKMKEDDVVIGFLPVKKSGRMPLVIPGPSIVFHARGYHGNSILGTYNPALVNQDISLISDWDKWVETKYWESYAKGIFPETHLLENILQDSPEPELEPKIDFLRSKLNAMFPEGWVMKGTTESNTGAALLTDKVDLKKEVNDYLKSDFEEFAARIAKASETAGEDEDEFFNSLQKHKNYMGWKIMKYLKEPDRAIVQRKMPIASEYRVEVVAGKVLKGATVDRYAYDRKTRGEAISLTPAEVKRQRALIKRLESWVQAQADMLPAEQRNLNWAFDVALLKDGRIVAIETNPGPCSGFLLWDEFPNSFRKLNAFLRDYYKRASANLFDFRGLRTAAQLAYIRGLFASTGMDTIKRPNVYKITANGLELKFPRVIVDPKFEMPPASEGECLVRYQGLIRP